MDFTVKQDTPPREPLTKVQGSEIFGLILLHKKVANAFKNQPDSKYSWGEFIQVNKEIDRLFREIGVLMSGSYLISAVEQHFDEELMEMVVDKEAVYYTPTTKTDLKTMFSSDILDDTAVLRSYVEWKGFNYDTQFEQFVASYKE